jgi:hypothetical protein
MRGLAPKRQDISNERIKLQPATRIEQKLLKLTAIFKYINSLLVKETHDRIFLKMTSNIPVDNGSSLNIPITIKITVLTNITLIETSVLLLYLLLYYLIFNRIPVIAPILGTDFRVLFYGGVSPSKISPIAPY